MSGPTVAIWPAPGRALPTAADVFAVSRLLDRSAASPGEIGIRSTLPIGGATTVEAGRPFGFWIGQTGFVYEPRELRSIDQALGFAPSGEVQVVAYGNSAVDHRMLAELAIYFAQTCDGFIDYGGYLGADVRQIAGKLFTIPYCAGSSPEEAFHVSDAAFLQQWLRDDDFHMIK